MLLKQTNATQEQIDVIYQNHIKPAVHDITYTYDEDDCVGFVSCYSKLGNWIQFYYLDKATSMTLRVDNHSYRIDSPDGVVLDRLNEIGLVAKTNWQKGGNIPILNENVTSIGSHNRYITTIGIVGIVLLIIYLITVL